MERWVDGSDCRQVKSGVVYCVFDCSASERMKGNETKTGCETGQGSRECSQRRVCQGSYCAAAGRVRSTLGCGVAL